MQTYSLTKDGETARFAVVVDDETAGRVIACDEHPGLWRIEDPDGCFMGRAGLREQGAEFLAAWFLAEDDESRIRSGLRTSPHAVVTRVLRELRHLEGMHAAASYFRQKAELCRELAGALASQHDPVVSKLHEMADEFDDNARILERRTAREEAKEDVSADAGNLH